MQIAYICISTRQSLCRFSCCLNCKNNVDITFYRDKIKLQRIYNHNVILSSLDIAVQMSQRKLDKIVESFSESKNRHRFTLLSTCSNLLPFICYQQLFIDSFPTNLGRYINLILEANDKLKE